ncbi:MAG: sulfatase atsG, partial [Bacteroidota bacterium]
GIHNGSESYPVRSIRDMKFKYIRNLSSSEPFYNLVTTRESSLFIDWMRHAPDSMRQLVAKYKFRPAEELYDIANDPFEMVNLATDPEYESIKQRLQKELGSWMKSQGDEGLATEMAALQRQERKNPWVSYNQRIKE